MCTVSWIRAPDGYELFCNRDERTSRAPELPPSVERRGEVSFVAPRDGDAGGAWIAANDRGLSLALLNGQLGPCGSDQACCASRGSLLADLAGNAGADEVRVALAAMDLGPFRPFTLLALEPGGGALLVEWDGATTRVERDADVCSPLASSAFDATRVRARRLALLDDMAGAAGGRVTSALLFAFHRSHGAGDFDGDCSPCLHGADAQTRSFCHVVVTPERVRFGYVPGPPCATAPLAPIVLARCARPALPT